MKKETHKPVIETMINTAALAMTSFGIVTLTTSGCTWEDLVKGLILIGFGAGLEFYKYWGRKQELW